MHILCVFYRYGDHRYLHVLTHSFPTRRSSDLNDKRLAGGVAALDAATAGEHEHTTPSLPLAQYAARYVDNWYGPIAITHDGQANGLRIDFLQSPNMAGALEHRSEEHTSELQSLMRTSYAVFCLKKKTTKVTKS